eukprot:GHRQ01017021.1.p1 GENE.GHRQ01017021.1~~GHRQ01017021.1.p1  ORF type:complete len:130 (+),score=25.98 GHRQ01017021.1:593-982(+)
MQLTGRLSGADVKFSSSSRGNGHVCPRPAARAYRAQPQQQTASIAWRQLEAGHVNQRAAVVARSSPAPASAGLKAPGQHLQQVNIVYKFGGSSVRDAERMREVADIICSFQENLPCVVLSAMGKVRSSC